MSKEVDYVSAALSDSGWFALTEFLQKNYRDYDSSRFAAFVEMVGDSEGHFEIGTHDSVSGVPVTLDIRGSEFWEEQDV